MSMLQDLEARESERQEVVAGAVHAVHRALADVEDYRVDLHALAMVLLTRLGPGGQAGGWSNPVGRSLYDIHVAPRIAAFTDDHDEATYLHMQVFRKVLVSVESAIVMRMLSRDMRLTVT